MLLSLLNGIRITRVYCGMFCVEIEGHFDQFFLGVAFITWMCIPLRMWFIPCIVHISSHISSIGDIP